jgi:hypothetical protein
MELSRDLLTLRELGRGEQRHLLVRLCRHGRVAIGRVAEEGLDNVTHAVLLGHDHAHHTGLGHGRVVS